MTLTLREEVAGGAQLTAGLVEVPQYAIKRLKNKLSVYRLWNQLLLMYFPSEYSMQEFLFTFFRAHGYKAATEVLIEGGGKADLVTPIHIIECKKVLTRSNLFEAAGQLTTYLKGCPDKILVIAGLTPVSGIHEARQAAQRLENVGYLVWFIDELEPFKSFYKMCYELH